MITDMLFSGLIQSASTHAGQTLMHSKWFRTSSRTLLDRKKVTQVV